MADAITEAMIEAGQKAAYYHRLSLASDKFAAIFLAMQAARQPQVPADDVEQALHCYQCGAARMASDDCNCTTFRLPRETLCAALTALQVTEGDKVERRVEAAYREGHCDGRDLARTGRQGSECMDWLDSETHAALHSKQEEEG